MRVLLATGPLAPDVPAGAVADAMAEGWRAGSPDAEVRALPLADGGPGTIEVIAAARGGSLEVLTVTGPARTPVPAQICLTGAPGAGAPGGGTAWLDAAEDLGARSSHGGGAPDLPATDVARGGSSRGAGELIEAALAAGVGRIVLTAGEQAVHDGGAGLLGVLGRAEGALADLLDAGGRAVGALGVDADTDASLAAVVARARERLAGVDVVVAATSDVPLFGLHGANAELHRGAGVDPGAAQDLERTLGHLYARLDRLRDTGTGGGKGAREGTGAPLPVAAPSPRVPGEGPDEGLDVAPGAGTDAGAANGAGRSGPAGHAAHSGHGHDHAGHRHAGHRRRSGLAPGSGCGGGIAAMLLHLGARLLPGAEVVAAEVGLPGEVERLGSDAVVVTAVPSRDGGVHAWSLPAVVGRLAAARALPVVAVARDVRTSARELAPLGISAAYPLQAGRRTSLVVPGTGAEVLAAARTRAARLARTWTPAAPGGEDVGDSDRNN